jgi:hypothetical protein
MVLRTFYHRKLSFLPCLNPHSPLLMLISLIAGRLRSPQGP